MGEEKPDEELMGKRKSSPRLSTTFNDVDTLMIARLAKNIHAFHITPFIFRPASINPRLN